MTIVIDLFFTVVFLVVMFYYSPILTYVVLGTIPLYLILSVLATPMFRQRLEEKFNRGAENQAFLVESINGMETVKAMAIAPAMQRKWEEQLAGYVKSSFRASNLSNIAGQIASFIGKITTIAILWIGAHLVMNGELTIGQLIAFNMLAGRVNGPIMRIVQLWQEFQQAGISLRRLGDLLNAPTEPNYSNRTSLPDLKGQIRFDEVTFRYQIGRPEVLRRLSLDIEAVENIGHVYTTRVSMKRTTMDVGSKSITLSPGMNVSVEVKTGQRRVIEFFLNPILRGFRETARER